MWTTYQRLLRSFVLVRIEPISLWSLVLCVTAPLKRNIYDIQCESEKITPLRLLSIFAKRLGMPSRLAKIDKSRRGGGNFFWLTLYTCQDCRMCTWMPVTARDDNLQLFDSNACCSANRHISLTSTQTHIEMIMMMMIMNGFVNSIINELFGTVVEIDHYNSRGLK